MCMTGEEISAEWSCVGNCVGVGLQELIWVVAVEGLGRGGKSPGDATTEDCQTPNPSRSNYHHVSPRK